MNTSCRHAGRRLAHLRRSRRRRIWSEDPRYFERWGSVLAAGVRRVTTLSTDAHQNRLPQLLGDGERIDSFRRLLLWFLNHVLIEPEADSSWDHTHLKQAILAGRL